MDTEDNVFENISDFVNDKSLNVRIIEDRIDINVQMEFFDRVEELGETELDAEEIIEKSAWLYLPEVSEDDKKEILLQLSCLDDVKAFRKIEEFLKTGESNLMSWAGLAFQKSRLEMESSFLNEKSVLISTGLGGKGDKLRYFIVLLQSDDVAITENQKSLLESELKFHFAKNEAVLEKFICQNNLVSITCLIPLRIPVHTIIDSVISDSNACGEFIDTSFLVSNVKEMSFPEIEEWLQKEEDDPETGNQDEDKN